MPAPAPALDENAFHDAQDELAREAAAVMPFVDPSQPGFRISDDFIAAMMHAYQFGHHRPSDQRIASGSSQRSHQEAVIMRSPKCFWPPQELGKRDKVHWTTRRLWETLFLEVVGKAQADMAREDMEAILEEAADSQGVIVNPWASYSITNNRQHLYFDIDTAPASGIEVPQIRETVNRFQQGIKDRVATRLRGILEDPEEMDRLRRILEISTELDLHVVLKQTIKRLDSVRSQTESLEEIQAFLALLKGACNLLGCPELEAELLSSADAAMGRDGVYKPGVDDESALIGVPMTHYRTGEPRTIDEVYAITAHEVAHHQMRAWGGKDMTDIPGMPEDVAARVQNAIAAGHPVHGLVHEMLTQRNLTLLRRNIPVPSTAEDDDELTVTFIPAELIGEQPLAEGAVDSIIRERLAEMAGEDSMWATKEEVQELARSHRRLRNWGIAAGVTVTMAGLCAGGGLLWLDVINAVLSQLGH